MPRLQMTPPLRRVAILLLVPLMLAGFLTKSLSAQQRVPHNQDAPPGPALSPAEALKKMTVPKGFQVELVASEPDIVNPVAMTFDERGRIWITESLEYPRHEPGPGRDRVKILEDTDQNGTADKVTVFAEGLNIPSGIAVGHGGVWVANAPDLLFLQDTDGDGKADRSEVIVTGFGRFDTHELPNSLIWGPDGWLYGLNGVFNFSHVTYSEQNPNYQADQPGWKFTCALFRIHPRTREFQVFAEGTSNPWGVAADDLGSFFFSACVIDHLWHIVESGYYHRQGGPYPPHTWKIDSIVRHKHQKAAYCGLTWFDSDAYPEPFRERLYMGNIHGNCINSDRVTRASATYVGTPEPDFLSANDAWFMPVSQKTGPDGCLYVLDWYDQYHCYQDANRDPAGIERAKGRLYRVRYQDSPRAEKFDLAQETDAQLITRLSSPNIYFRETAQRVLTERNHAGNHPALEQLALNQQQPRKVRMHALWMRVSTGDISPAFLTALLQDPDPEIAAWGLRAAGDAKDPQPLTALLSKAVSTEPAQPAVLLQAAIAAKKMLPPPAATDLLMKILGRAGDDPLIPRIVWQNFYPLLQADPRGTLLSFHKAEHLEPHLAEFGPRINDVLLARPNWTPQEIALLLDSVLPIPGAEAAGRRCLAGLASRIQTGEIPADRLAALRKELEPLLAPITQAGPENPLYFDATLLAVSWKDPKALAAGRAVVTASDQLPARRLQAIEALIAAGDGDLLDEVTPLLSDREHHSPEFRGQVIAALGRMDTPRVAAVTLAAYPQMEPELQPKVIELLTGRIDWALPLLAAIREKTVPATALNTNQVRKLLATKDAKLVEQVTATWGTLREGRSPEREQVIAEMRRLLRMTQGDPHAGKLVFAKVCGQCHKMYGEGQEVGPDITLNGRSSFAQLLSNVFDPSLVIGAAYQARTVVTDKGQVLTGLVVEEGEQRIVLKIQGGKQEIIPRSQIEEMKTSELSMMPEALEKQITPQEMADLFAYLTLDKPPTDPAAKQLPGVREVTQRQTNDPKLFGEILAEVAPGFTMDAVGEGGLVLIPEFRDRPAVLRTHPLAPGKPCILKRTLEVPADKKTRLLLTVAHDKRGDAPDWQLIVKANGKPIHDSIIGPKTTLEGWADIAVDLSSYASQTINLELHNHPNDWAYEFGYWNRVEVVSE